MNPIMIRIYKDNGESFDGGIPYLSREWSIVPIIGDTVELDVIYRVTGRLIHDYIDKNLEVTITVSPSLIKEDITNQRLNKLENRMSNLSNTVKTML